ncbi:MAG: tripartite tricarboxylate transporter permease, partial [Rhodospirillales bacterium]|nr:tripartite tricarboxylate transporter permease [Rhodospirillales bacterium]
MMWLAIGVFIGVGVGAMPGLSASTGVALMLPLTFTLPQASALGLLIGLYKGAIYGGSISAISFATPGTSEAAATVFDGHKMMRRGEGRKALLMALYASVTADFLSDVIT